MEEQQRPAAAAPAGLDPAGSQASLELERGAQSGGGNGGKRHSPNTLASLAHLSPEGTARLFDVYRLSSNRLAQRAARRQCSGALLTCNTTSTSNGGDAGTAPPSPVSTPETPRTGGRGAATNMLWKSGSLPQQQQQHQTPLRLDSGDFPRLRALSLGLQPLLQPLQPDGDGAPPAAASPRRAHAASGCLTVGEGADEARAYVSRPAAAGCGLAHGRGSPLQQALVGATRCGNSHWGGVPSGPAADAAAGVWDPHPPPHSPSHGRRASPGPPLSDSGARRPVSDTAVHEPPGVLAPQRRSLDLRCRPSAELPHATDSAAASAGGGQYFAGSATAGRRANSLCAHPCAAEEKQGGRVSPGGAGGSVPASRMVPASRNALALVESQLGALGRPPGGRLPGSRHAARPLPLTRHVGSGAAGCGCCCCCCCGTPSEEADSDGGEGGPMGRLLRRSGCCVADGQVQLTWVGDGALGGDDGSSVIRGEGEEGVAASGVCDEGGRASGAAEGVRPALSQTHLAALLERLRAARGAAKRA